MPRITLTTAVPGTPVEVLANCLDVDLHTQSMGRNERAIAGVTTGRLGLGDEVRWRARHFGVTWHMTVRITGLESPHHFVDEQVSGPFRRWRHEHSFTPHPGTPDGTTMHDVIDFEAPGGAAGSFVAAVFLRPYLKRLIRGRNTFLCKSLRQR